MSSADTFPIVLAHGIARFDALREVLVQALQLPGVDLHSTSDSTHYFRKIASSLRRNGLDVHHSSVDFAGPVNLRAAELRTVIHQIIQRPGSPQKVHIIGHSMGGLDARHMLFDFREMTDHVASVTTIGTPHLGSSVAEWLLANGGPVLTALSPLLDTSGLADLTRQACRGFNQKAAAFEAENSVQYQTYASSQERQRIFAPLQAGFDIIMNRLPAVVPIDGEGEENDGLVPLSSQQWHKTLTSSGGVSKEIRRLRFAEPADHLNEVGWWDPAELNPSRGFFGNIRDAFAYEDRIRAIYLGIAEGLSALQ